MATMPTTSVTVVAGIVGDVQGQVLIAKRSTASHQGNQWEFPGGKVAIGESITDALVRELQEELGIIVVDYSFYQHIDHHYRDLNVNLNFFLVRRYLGRAIGCEGQPVYWIHHQQLNDYKFPKANATIIKALVSGWPF